MKKLIVGATVLALAAAVAGCAKTSATTKPVTKEKSGSTSTAVHKTTTPVEHTTMKPVTPSAGTEHKATLPEAKPVGTASPVAKQPESKPEIKAPAGKEKPKENK